MKKAYILTGGNIGNRESNLAKARELIGLHVGPITQASALYVTEPWGKSDQPAFLNQALEVRTNLNSSTLMDQLLNVEKIMGRVRREKYGPRLIDIDLLLFGNEKRDLSALRLPHPELANRRFALMPLAEIAGKVIHPVLMKSIAQLLEECKDQLDVRKIDE